MNTITRKSPIINIIDEPNNALILFPITNETNGEIFWVNASGRSVNPRTTKDPTTDDPSNIFDFLGTFPPKIPRLNEVNNRPKSFCIITNDGTIKRTKNIPKPKPNDKVIIVGFKN